jgi:hypothetical protein
MWGGGAEGKGGRGGGQELVWVGGEWGFSDFLQRGECVFAGEGQGE